MTRQPLQPDRRYARQRRQPLRGRHFQQPGLYYPAGSPDRHAGLWAGGIFTTNTTNKSGVGANSLWNPNGVVAGRQWQSLRSRREQQPGAVLSGGQHYGNAGLWARRQFYHKHGKQWRGRPPSLNNPYGVGIDSGGNLYVNDTVNNRALFYPALKPSTTNLYASTPDPMYGQSVTFQAGVLTLSGNQGPTGTVTFLDGGTVLASPRSPALPRRIPPALSPWALIILPRTIPAIPTTLRAAPTAPSSPPP